ncbi:MAG: MBL fold metallo-hydrolase [Planctomycetota bacterium]|nr:MBL fold metallo-hydrolase [Planctomycetota bacterium]
MGFVYLPPFRVQGISVAGEEAVVQVPELELAFDIGLCPRPVLSAKTVALSHAHMDHIAGLPYWFSQRHFQQQPPGRVVCHHAIAGALDRMMQSWVDLEQQRTPYEIIPLAPGQCTELGRDRTLHAIEMPHTVPALGYCVRERRRKLRPEFVSLSSSEIRVLRERGTDITHEVDIPLIAYTGDTAPGDHLLHDLFRTAKILIVECTFFLAEHYDRAGKGKHLHIRDIERYMASWQAEDIVLVHLSRRTPLPLAREVVADVSQGRRLHLLMDSRTNRARYEARLLAAGGKDEPAKSAAGDPQPTE